VKVKPSNRSASTQVFPPAKKMGARAGKANSSLPRAISTKPLQGGKAGGQVLEKKAGWRTKINWALLNSSTSILKRGGSAHEGLGGKHSCPGESAASIPGLNSVLSMEVHGGILRRSKESMISYALPRDGTSEVQTSVSHSRNQSDTSIGLNQPN